MGGERMAAQTAGVGDTLEKMLGKTSEKTSGKRRRNVGNDVRHF
jgi:hypothetical protein